MSVHELRQTCFDHFAQPELLRGGALRVRIMSFGFKYGPPHDADLILDVRFLPNPYFIDELRELSGHDEPVAQVRSTAPRNPNVSRPHGSTDSLLPSALSS